jgi:hypothetical protein
LKSALKIPDDGIQDIWFVDHVVAGKAVQNCAQIGGRMHVSRCASAG